MRTIGSISAELCELERLREHNLQLHAKDLKWQRRIAAAASSNASFDCQASAIGRSSTPEPSLPFGILSSPSTQPALANFSTQNAPPVSSTFASASLPVSSIASTMAPSVIAPMSASISASDPAIGSASAPPSMEANIEVSLPLSMPMSISNLGQSSMNAFTPASACPSPSFPFSASALTSSAASASVPVSASGSMSGALKPSSEAYALTAATLASLGVTPAGAQGFPSATASHAHALPTDAHAHYPSAPFVMPMMFTTPSAAKPPLPVASPASAAAALMSSVSAPAFALPISMPMHFQIPPSTTTVPAFPTTHAAAPTFLAPPTSIASPVPVGPPSAPTISPSQPVVLPNVPTTVAPSSPNPVAFAMTPSMPPASATSTPEIRQYSVASSESPTVNQSQRGEDVGTTARADASKSMAAKAKSEKRLTANVMNVSDKYETMSTSGTSSVTKRRAITDYKKAEVSGGGSVGTSGPGSGVLKSGIGKIRRHRMTKEEEARFNPRDLVDLTGSTAAKSRKMSNEERDIMLHKRRLRNRASAARSRDKQRKTINDISDEVDELLEISKQLLERCVAAESSMSELKQKNDALVKENRQLRINQQDNQQDSGDNSIDRDDDKVVPVSEAMSAPMSTPTTTALKRSGSTLHVSMSSDMLDKLMGTGMGSGDMAIGGGLMKFSSTLHLSLSTDRLSEGSNGSFPCISGSLPPLTRNASIVDRLLDISGSSAAGGGELQVRRVMKEQV